VLVADNEGIERALVAAQEAVATTGPAGRPEGSTASDGSLASVRPRLRAQPIDQPIDQQTVAAADPVQEVVRRVSTSGGRTWGVNIGRYPTEYKARQVLLQTALTEMSTLDDSLRKVVRRPTGFDANFMGMTRDSADLACRRLQAKQISCFMIGPG